jgi:hypothetical protein
VLRRFLALPIFRRGFFCEFEVDRKLRFTIIGIGGRLTQAVAVPVKSAWAARWHAIAYAQWFKCEVVVTNERGMRVSMVELEEFAKAEVK